MTIRAMDLRCCAVHGQSLHEWSVCIHCAAPKRPIPNVKEHESVNRVRRYRAKLRMAKARAGKRTAAQERAEREERGSLARV